MPATTTTTLKADNRTLLVDQKYSFLLSNYTSGTTTVYVANPEGFSVDQYVLLGNFGAEGAEILRIATVSSSTGAMTFKNDAAAPVNTKFAHPESTKVTVIPYNQIRFFWTATTTYGTSDPVTSQIDLQPSDWYTIGIDSAHSGGYGWYTYYNVANSTFSANSAYIPYGGYDEKALATTVKSVFSLLNNKELRLLSREEVLGWLNEGYAIIRNNLNMVNHEYFVSDVQQVPIIAGTQEYSLPADFSDIIVVWSGQQVATSVSSPEIQFISLHDANLYQGLDPRYYIRGKYIGFIPIPTGMEQFYYRYVKKATILSLDSDVIDLPDDAVYAVKDFVLYRAYQKLSSPQSTTFLKSFSDWINNMKVFAIKRDGADDAWSISPKANV